MSVGVQITWDSRALGIALDRFVQRQVPFATALALTRIGQRVKADEYQAMKTAFDRPTPFTMNSLLLRPATKGRPEATVWFKDFATKGTPAAKYLLPQVQGGGRSHKRFEGALRARGILGAKEFIMPAKGAPLDAYGNVSRGVYSKVLSDLGAQRDARQNSRKAGRFFVGTIGNVRGIFAAKSQRSLRMIFLFVAAAPRYEPRFDFFGIARRVQDQRYAREFTKALEEALRTAR